MSALLEVDEIHTFYGGSHILNGLSLKVGAGEVVGVLGRNGAGKTTTIRSIAGLTPPRRGRVVLQGEPIQGKPAYTIARRGVALVPQGRGIFAPLTVRENLMLGARGEGWTLDRVFGLFPRLQERLDQLGGTLSGGEQQMLSFGRALLTNSKLLLLDEPSEGLSPRVVKEVGEIVKRLREEKMSILIVEQNSHLALDVSDRVYVISKGEIAYEGSSADLAANDEVKRKHLGVA